VNKSITYYGVLFDMYHVLFRGDPIDRLVFSQLFDKLITQLIYLNCLSFAYRFYRIITIKVEVLITYNWNVHNLSGRWIRNSLRLSGDITCLQRLSYEW